MDGGGNNGSGGGGSWAGDGGAAGRPASTATRKETETAAERARRHAEKKRRVDEHRKAVLARKNVESARSKLHKPEDLICPIHFSNALPPLPVEAKSMTFPFDEDGAYAYDIAHGVSSEAGALNKLHAELDMGLTFNFVELEAYPLPPALAPGGAAPAPPTLHPLDEEICSAEYARPATRKREAFKEDLAVDWMRRSMFMHLDLYDSVYKHADPAQVAAAAMAKKQRELAAARRGKGTGVARVEHSFAAVGGSVAVAHPTRPGALHPVRVWNVVPAVGTWGATRAAVTFDDVPDDAGSGRSLPAPAKRARLESGILRTAANAPLRASADRSVHVDYYLPLDADDVRPTGPSTADAVDSDGHATRHMQPVRQYVMAVDPVDRSAGQEVFALYWDDDEAVVRLAPVRMVAGLTKTVQVAGAPSSTSTRPGGNDEDDGDEERRVGDRGGRGGGSKASRVIAVKTRAWTAGEVAALQEASAQVGELEATGRRAAAAARRVAAEAAEAGVGDGDGVESGVAVAGVKRQLHDMSRGMEDEEATSLRRRVGGDDDDDDGFAQPEGDE